MYPMALRQYLAALDETLRYQDDAKLARLLTEDNNTLDAALGDIVRGDWQRSASAMERLLNKELSPRVHSWIPMVAQHMAARALHHSLDHIHAYKQQQKAHEAFMEIFDDEPMISSLLKICSLLARSARAADEECVRKKEIPEYQRAAVGALNSTIHKLSNEIEYKVYVLPIVNILCAVYFRLNLVQMCKNVIRNVKDRQALLPMTEYPKPVSVTFQFYEGRQYLMEGYFKTAEKKLFQAFIDCSKRYKRNKRTILSVLMPLRLLFGVSPTRGLLEKYRMSTFSDFVEAVKIGDLALFRRQCGVHQAVFASLGIWAVVEKLRMVCFRNLFLRVFHISKIVKPKMTIVHLAKFHAALSMLCPDMDADEVECITANLIHKGYLKGYISHANQVLVVSANPFPPIGTVSI